MNGSCPQTAVLSDYLAGRAIEPLAREVEGHLKSCRACQQALVQSAPATDSLLRAVQTTPTGDPGQSDPELAVALKMIGTLHSATTHPGGAKDAAADTGRLISNYELQKKLGEGGMGAVYLARHLRLKKAVAIKLLKSDRSRDDGAIARFQVEIEAVGKLEHPHIVRALDAGEDKGTHFLVMEYLAGIDLARLVRGLGSIGLADACELIRQAALGLHHAHENNVIHRDVKPSNMMLLAGGKVKVLDLGLAHFRPDWSESVGLTGDHQVLGTLLYVAPEQLVPGGKVDARSDIFSLGVTLIEVLLGRVPPKQGFALVLSDHERSARTDVPPDIWQLAARMTALEPADRPASMLAVAETLRPWCVGANLVQLLARLAGRTTFADPRLPQGTLTPPGVGAALPVSDSVDDLTVQEVIAPPITAFGPRAGDQGQASEIRGDVAPTVNGRSSWNRVIHRNLTWLVGGGLVAVLIGILIWANPKAEKGNPGGVAGTNPPIPTPQKTGGLRLVTSNPAFERLVQQISERGGLRLRPEDKNEDFLLGLEGQDDLPVGKCILQAHRELDWEIASKELSIFAGETITVDPDIRFPTPWNCPRIPEPGQQVVYSGSLTRRPLRATGGSPAKGAGQRVPYSLTITALKEAVAGKPHRWLHFDLVHDLHDYRESAYLLVNVKDYRDFQRLRIAEGWIEASSQRIARTLKLHFPEAPPPALTAEFQSSAPDTLEEAAEKIGVSLPADRIGIHTPLVLLFGAECETADSLIRSARALLPAPTRFELGKMNAGPLIFTGLVVTAEESLPAVDADGEPQQIRLVLKRSETVPFSFVNIVLDSPVLAADLRVVARTEAERPLTEVADVPTERLALDSQRIRSLVSTPDALDVATLPDTPGDGVSYSGTLEMPKSAKMPSGVKLGFDVQLRVLGSDTIDGRRHRWLEVGATTKLPGGAHLEEAVLLIDEDEFRQHGKLVAPRGWFKFGSHWLPFTTTVPRPVEAIEEDLWFLDAPLPAMRLGVHDVLALISKTSKTPLQSMFGDVRGEFAHWRSLHDVTPKPIPDDKFSFGTAGKTVAADIWSVGEEGKVPWYKIVRSPEMPFDFVDVEITTDAGMVLTAYVDHVISTNEEELAKIKLPDAAAWEAQKAAHRKLVDAQRLAQPNHRLWSWRTPDGAVVRQWAEYGGKAGGMFLLRDKAGNPFSVPQAALDDDDRRAMEAGRWWHDREGEAFLRGELIAWQRQQDKTLLTMRRTDGEGGIDKPWSSELTLTRFEDEDQELLKELMGRITEKSSPMRGPVRGLRGR